MNRYLYVPRCYYLREICFVCSFMLIFSRETSFACYMLCAFHGEVTNWILIGYFIVLKNMNTQTISQFRS
jgi:hypothetical protein